MRTTNASDGPSDSSRTGGGDVPDDDGLPAAGPQPTPPVSRSPVVDTRSPSHPRSTTMGPGSRTGRTVAGQ